MITIKQETIDAYPHNDLNASRYTIVSPSLVTEEEKEQALFKEAIRRLEQDSRYLEAQRLLAIKDLLGYNNEMQIIERLIIAGLYRKTKHIGITYRNPKNPYYWKRQKANGVDLVFRIGELNIYIEMGFSSKPYKMQAPWFFKNRLPRYRFYKADSLHIRLYVTNRPENLSEIQNLFQKYGIAIMDVKGLIGYLQQLIAKQYKSQPQPKAKAKTKSRSVFCSTLSRYTVSKCNSANTNNHNITSKTSVYASIKELEFDEEKISLILENLNLLALKNG
jgi:hypothetical protein